MTLFANMEEGMEWIQPDHLVEVLIIPESILTYPLDTHHTTEIVELVIEFIKEDIIHLINHPDNFLLFLDKHVYEYVWISTNINT